MSQSRFVHLSDVHIREPHPGWRIGDLVTKRVTGRLNLLHRGWKFDRAQELLKLLVEDILSRRPEGVIFSGDASALGFRSEIESAARALHIRNPGMPPAIAVPGNHDHYVNSAVREGAFETEFAPWQQGQRIEAHRYPFAREIDGVWFVGVNSCRPNLLPWDASGAVGGDQLDRLDRLLATLTDGPRALVTHYPFFMGDGRAEPVWHQLRNRDALAALCIKHRVRLWLCGHRHAGYAVPPSDRVPFAVVCAGSATQLGRASYVELLVDGIDVSMRRHVFDMEVNCYRASNDVVKFPKLFQP